MGQKLNTNHPKSFERQASQAHPTMTAKTKQFYYITKHLNYLLMDSGRKKLPRLTHRVLQINHNFFHGGGLVLYKRESIHDVN